MKCKNCEIALIETANYCNNCGARVIRNRLTFKNLLAQAGEEFFNYDNKLLKTLIDLVKKPEVVIGSYIDGIRKKYINPVSFFAISLAITGISIFIMSRFKDQLDLSKLGGSAGKFYNQENRALQESMMNLIFDYGSLFSYLYIPFMTVLSFITFFNKRYNFTEHIVLYLYSFSFTSILSFFIMFIPLFAINPSEYFSYAYYNLLLILLYNSYALIRIFKLTFWQFFLKLLIFITLMFFIFIGSVILLIVLNFLGFVDLSLFVPEK